jgi:lactate permease
MIPLSSFSASVVGIFGGYLLSKIGTGQSTKVSASPQLKGGLLSYGFLFASVVIVSLIKPLNAWLSGVRLTSAFPQVITDGGFITAAGSGFILKPLTHPGTLILLTAAVAAFILPRIVPGRVPGIKKVLSLTWHSALPASLGTIFMIGLSSLMEHTGMSLLIAQGLSQSFGAVYHLIAPLVGTLGTFAAGSNTNSNVLFGPMQKGVAELLKMSPIVMLAAQTTGGALGSMIAPAKLAVGGSTNTMKGREGEVLRITLPVGIVCTALIGGLVWLVLALSG